MENAPESDWTKRYEESIRNEQAASPIPRWQIVHDSLRNVFYLSVVAASAVSWLLTLVGVRGSVALLLALTTCFFAVGLVVRRKIGQRQRR
jgi:hypothetical protein